MSLYSERVAQDSPLFYFENNSSGVNNTGSVTPSIVTGSSTTFTSNGGVQNSPYLVNADRTGEYGFEYSDSTAIFNDRVFSITGWFKVNSTDINTNPNYILHAGTTANGIYLQKTDKLYVGGNFNTASVATSTAPSFDAWHHVGITMDTTNLKLYIDGSLIQTVSSPASLSIDSEIKYWMRATTTGTPRNGVAGSFDEWAIFNTALSATTISEHYVTGFGVKVIETPATATALAVDPAISTQVVIVETPATASATSGDHFGSAVDLPKHVKEYLQTLSLSNRYDFETIDARNLGTGGTVEWYQTGPQITAFGGRGIQLESALRITGSTADGSMVTYSSPLLNVINGATWSIGFFVKGPDVGTDGPGLFGFTNDSGAYFNVGYQDKLSIAYGNGGNHSFESQSDLLQNAWNFVVVERTSDDKYRIYLNGSLDKTHNIIGTVPTNYGNFTLSSNETSSLSNYLYVSELFLSTPSVITSTVVTNIQNASIVPVQASGYMNDVKLSFNNAYNNLVETFSPVADLRFDSAGEPYIDNGPNGGELATRSTSTVTKNVLTKNTRGMKLNSSNSTYYTQFTSASNTFTDGTQSIAAHIKLDTGTPAAFQYIASTGVFGGPVNGSGLSLVNLDTGHLAVYYLSFYVDPYPLEVTIDTEVDLNDGKWHYVVATISAGTVKVYVDGALVKTQTSTGIELWDAMTLTVGGDSYWFGINDVSKGMTIDEVQVFSQALTAQNVIDLYQAIGVDNFGASSLMVEPAYSAGFGPTIAEPPMNASADLPNVFPFILPMNSDAMFQNPNYAAIRNTDNLADPMTADAQGENPGWNVGENNVVLHMNASAEFPEARALIPGFWNASPAIANPAEMVEPAISSTLGALIKADPLRAGSFFQLPPAYYLVTDDLWYQRLVEIDYQSETDNGIITFFNTSSDIYLAGGYSGWNAYNNRNPLNANYGYNLYDVPLPVATAGYFDTTNRKALNLRNIALENGDREYQTGTTWSMEAMIQTTKKNQFIAAAFNPGNPASSTSRKNRTGIRLKDGKIAFTDVIDSTLGMLDSNSAIQFTGFKDIADGEWHHIIIQYRSDGVDQNNPRTQVWIDGKLDIQRFGQFAYAPGQIGFNSNDVDAYSDFNISAISINRGSYVLEREIILNYLASFNIIPVKAPVATATAEIGQGSKAAGNRGRALMLYFWPTTTQQAKNLSYANFTSTESAIELTTLDYFTKPPQEYEGWDVFPVDITGYWVSDLVKPEAYGIGNIASTNFIKDVTPYGRTEQADIALFNRAGTFKDPVTDAARYIDLINDMDLSKFDMIMFKNYPNDPAEKDAFTGEEVVDAYFNLRESKLFADFLITLRAAVDTGLSLMVSNAQLALDLKIVDRVETVPDMDDDVATDPYAPTQMLGTTSASAADLPTPPAYSSPLGWRDTWKNNRTRIVNTYPGITDYPALVKTEQAFWQSTDELRWGGADRMFIRYEHKDALAVGDEFVISTTGLKANNNTAGYLATPFENVKAGTIITAFSNTIRRGLDLIENPYRNYAQSIILEPGDVLDGTQVGGKIYVNFTEEINKCQEQGSLELISDYWVNYAYDNGAITLTQRDNLLAAEYNLNETPYWSLDGMHILQQTASQFTLDDGDDNKGTGVASGVLKVRKIDKNGGLSFKNEPTGNVFFSSTYSWQYPMATFELPSMPTRGFRWLSNREVLEGTIIRPQAFIAQAEMPNAAGIPDRESNFNAQSMVASANIEETQFSSGERQVIALPMTATADIVKPGSTIAAPPMFANAKMFDNSRSNVASEDQVVLYLMHVDPILYIREDVIK